MKKIALTVFLCVIAHCALAQRTVQGQYYFQAQCSFIQGATPRVGFGIYDASGCWQFDSGVRFAYDPKDITVGIDGGYNWRLLSSFDRAFSLYGGVGGSFGYFIADKKVDEPVDDKPLLGLYPKLEVEAFPFASVAFFLSCSSQYVFFLKKVPENERKGMFCPEASFGLRFML